MTRFLADLEAIGQLVRVKEETKVDELVAIMQANPDTAVLLELTFPTPHALFPNDS